MAASLQPFISLSWFQHAFKTLENWGLNNGLRLRLGVLL
jgi:hypothetical protein